jgi:hypothetical protein
LLLLFHSGHQNPTTQWEFGMVLIPVCDEVQLKGAGIFYRPGTLRKWHSEGQQPHLFKKVRRRLFIDLEAWRRFLEVETGSQN